MSVINFRRKEIIAKVVYYGPGLSGKTTNVQQIHASMPVDTRGDLTSLATEGDRTLFFDYVPIHLGNIGGFKTKFQIFTVPGQIYYSATRRIVLQSTDGVVFVADSSPDALDRNLESLADLRQNLLHYDKFLNTIPFVIQYNKRDLPDAMPVEELERQLNQLGVPSFSAVAMNADGVLETLSKISSLVLTHLKASIEGKLSQGKRDPTVIQKFDAEEPDDAALVSSLLAQITEVRKHEAAEVSIVDEDEEIVPASEQTGSRSPGMLPPMPSMSAVATVGSASRMPSTGAFAPPPVYPPPPDMQAEQLVEMPEMSHGPVHHVEGPISPPPPVPQQHHSESRQPVTSEPPPIPVRTTVPLPNRAITNSVSGIQQISSTPLGASAGGTPATDAGANSTSIIPSLNSRPVAAQTTAPLASPRTSGDRGLPGFGPGDAPPWDNGPAGRPSPERSVAPSSAGRPLPVPMSGNLEVVEVGQVNRRGSEVTIPLTVRDTASGETRSLNVQLKLTDGAAAPARAAIPAYIYYWLAGITILNLLALILAVTR